MEQYIKKSTLVAEIERLRENQRLDDRHGQGVLDGLYAIERFIDTLEVKEVNLDKEIDDFMAKEWEGIEEKDEPFYSMIKNDLTDVAKHFFELGLQARQQ